MPRFGFLSLALATLTSAAVAQDKVPAFVDMRLNLQGTTLDYQINGADLTHDISTRVGVSWTGSLGLKAYGGVIWGLGGTWGYGKDEGILPGGIDLTIQTATIDGFIGYAFPFSEFLQIEVMPVISAGRVWLHSSGPGRQSDHKGYWEYGVRGNLVWTLGNGFQFGVISDIIIANENRINAEVGATTIGDLDNSRIAVGAFIGVRL